MHFQEIKDNYYKDIPKKIKEFIPGFVSIFDEEDGIYPILGDLGNFIIDNINNEKYLSKIMFFINNAIENGGTDTCNAIILQIFDKYYDEIGNITEIEKYLTKKNKLKLKTYFQEYKK
ncbi:hypothetical protein [Chryseobacterium daecheongense]|uniref:Uncharacterized protein n=1 Tax=Chryseobacterium daecheongense TaxID=192389 RepID=A0A3N0W2U1_9FLAO|nr:hypothetical protein [Chryseobacterium daecheongense]ROH99385.1 hypothetical protein EGI05_00365 [Chryseobacterium daecheongense]TDX95718.1 hypothetical protein BCF50_1501 [Chryseobacterium daecheongense]